MKIIEKKQNIIIDPKQTLTVGGWQCYHQDNKIKIRIYASPLKLLEHEHN